MKRNPLSPLSCESRTECQANYFMVQPHTPYPQRGILWADRFKHTLLGDSRAVWQCVKYIQMNPVRARIVSNPADYRFCSYGA